MPAKFLKLILSKSRQSAPAPVPAALESCIFPVEILCVIMECYDRAQKADREALRNIGLTCSALLHECRKVLFRNVTLVSGFCNERRCNKPSAYPVPPRLCKTCTGRLDFPSAAAGFVKNLVVRLREHEWPRKTPHTVKNKSLDTAFRQKYTGLMSLDIYSPIPWGELPDMIQQALVQLLRVSAVLEDVDIDIPNFPLAALPSGRSLKLLGISQRVVSGARAPNVNRTPTKFQRLYLELEEGNDNFGYSKSTEIFKTSSIVDWAELKEMQLNFGVNWMAGPSDEVINLGWTLPCRLNALERLILILGGRPNRPSHQASSLLDFSLLPSLRFLDIFIAPEALEATLTWIMSHSWETSALTETIEINVTVARLGFLMFNKPDGEHLAEKWSNWWSRRSKIQNLTVRGFCAVDVANGISRVPIDDHV